MAIKTRFELLGGLALILSSCVQVDAADAEPPAEPDVKPSVVEDVEQPPIPETVEPEPVVDPQPVSETFEFGCGGFLRQGGLLVCEVPEGSVVYKNGQTVSNATDSGVATIGLRQNEGAIVTVEWMDKAGKTGLAEYEIAPRYDDVRNLKGMDCDKVDARTQAQKDHAGRSWKKKVDAFAKFNKPIADGVSFSKPAEGPTSSPFGPTRHYSGVSKVTGETCNKTSVHRGQDFATPIGTDLVAPMAGTVILADLDLYYEGGAIFVDHGFGLVSVFMHLSEVDVNAGDVVAQGERLGATGNTGRTTGPHLHWAVKWRADASDKRSDDFYIDPQLLLALENGEQQNSTD